jgi:PAP_fibrillin
LNAIRGTNNGKTATPQQQIQILQIVRDLEMAQPNISITDPNTVSLLNGTWYLQYTSPSTVESTTTTTTTTNDDDNVDPTQQPNQPPPPSSSVTSSSYVWEPNNAALENVETRRFNARGTVSAAGITIDTSSNNALVQQIFYTDTSTVMNRIYFTKAKSKNSSDSDNNINNSVDNSNIKYALAGGTYRPSTIQPNRAIVAFNTAQIRIPTQLNFTITIPLGWIFAVVALFRNGNRDNGWLETTFIDASLRIGRGNKGTMFILTREPLSLA